VELAAAAALEVLDDAADEVAAAAALVCEMVAHSAEPTLEASVQRLRQTRQFTAASQSGTQGRRGRAHTGNVRRRAGAREAGARDRGDDGLLVELALAGEVDEAAAGAPRGGDEAADLQRAAYTSVVPHGTGDGGDTGGKGSGRTAHCGRSATLWAPATAARATTARARVDFMLASTHTGSAGSL